MRTVPLLIAIGGAATLLAQSPAGYSSSRQMNAALATSVTGQVSRLQDGQPWAVTSGDEVAGQQLIMTGTDGYAHFQVAGGSSFDLFGNTRVIFRHNPANEGDLLDILGGRARIHLQLSSGELQRIFSPIATITAHQTATIALAIDEDDNVRIDVIEGAVRVQHAFLPRSEAVLVTAVDSVLVQRNERMSRQMDRGSLYRYTVKPLKEMLSVITPGHSPGHNALPDFAVGAKILAQASRPQSPGR